MKIIVDIWKWNDVWVFPFSQPSIRTACLFLWTGATPGVCQCKTRSDKSEDRPGQSWVDFLEGCNHLRLGHPTVDQRFLCLRGEYCTSGNVKVHQLSEWKNAPCPGFNEKNYKFLDGQITSFNLDRCHQLSCNGTRRIHQPFLTVPITSF